MDQAHHEAPPGGFVTAGLFCASNLTMTPTATATVYPSRSPAVWLTALVGAVFVLLGLNAYLNPVGASAGFGLPMQGAAETTFVRVWGSRNALLGALAVTFVALGMRRAAAILLSMATVMPAFDAAVVVSRIGWDSLVLTRHATAFAVLVALSVALWRVTPRDGGP